MKTTLTCLTACLLLLGVAPRAQALEQVSLQSALAASLAERPMLRASAAEVEAAEAEVRGRASRYLPRLTLSERFVRTDEPGGSLFAALNQRRFVLSPDASAYNEPPSRSNFETRLTLDQPLFDPDLKFERERAEFNRAAQGALHERHREEALLATLEAFLAVQQGHARVAWAEQFLKEAQETLSMAGAREAEGVGLHADTLRGEVQLNDAQRQLLEARNAVQDARRRLALAMGRAGGEVDIETPVPLDLIQPPAGAGVRRGDLLALEHGVAGAEAAARQRRAAYLPRVGLQASYALNERDLSFSGDGDSWSVGAGLEWRLFDAGERSSALAAAQARQLALELQRSERENEARAAQAAAVERAGEADARLALARSSLAAAEAGRAMMAERYSAGLATLTELLAVQTELTRVRSELAAAETGLVSARAHIHFEQGGLVRALLGESEARP